ncbi:MAG TPA: endonuclease III [Gemmatimonadaceae bacterium]|nr:endonuclease III [Gemmatimonadaceae bacterium]
MRRTAIKIGKGKRAVRKGKATVRRISRAELGPYSREVFTRLKAAHPDAHCELDHETPLQLLVATILSAQCTDKRVNMVTPLLFRTYPTAAALADAPPEKLEEIIKSTGFFRNKTKSLIALGKALVERYGGEVPDSMEALVKLPGVGRKTANVILGNAFRKNEGVVVDTHVGRLSARLGLSKQKDPVKIEEDLMPLFPRDDWAMLAHVLIFHGRRVCDAGAPKCDICSLNEICPSSTVSIYRETT